jgi:hypothetical protein
MQVQNAIFRDELSERTGLTCEIHCGNIHRPRLHAIPRIIDCTNSAHGSHSFRNRRGSNSSWKQHVSPGISRSMKEWFSSGHASGRWNRRAVSSSNPLSVPQRAQAQPQRSRSQLLLKYPQQLSQRGTRSPKPPVAGRWPRSSAAAKGVTATPHWRAHASSASGTAGKRETVARTAIAAARWGRPGGGSEGREPRQSA